MKAPLEVGEGAGSLEEILWPANKGFVCVPSPSAFFASPPRYPVFFNHPMTSGSLPSAQSTSTPYSTFSVRPLKQTAANALPICLNRTRAVTRLGFFGGEGPREMTIELSSIVPKGARRPL